MEWLGSERKERMENGMEGKNWGCSPLDSRRVWDELNAPVKCIS